MAGTIKHPHGHEFPAPPPNPSPPEGAQTLFERLGGRAGVSRLIKWFYARVRFEPDLEPIFNAHVPKWGEHLELLIDFWCGQAGGPTTYRGGLGKHARLDLGPEHFATWLRVWEQNCTDLLRPQEAKEMVELAAELAKRMQPKVVRTEEASGGA
jgi:hemoglobin